MFRVGDTVICIGTSIGWDGEITYGGAGWKIGHKFKIDRISRNNNGTILWGAKGLNGVWSHHVELYCPKIREYGISKFIKSLNK
jgi:hypothetical protein